MTLTHAMQRPSNGMTFLRISAIVLCLVSGNASSQIPPAPEPEPEPEELDLAELMRALDPDWKPPQVDQSELDKHPLGSEKNPVRVHGPQGERDYLSRLRCEDKEQPSFRRIGSTGQSPFGFIMDAYGVSCSGRTAVTVYMDMYHSKYVETRPVPGFTLIEKPGT